jgi:uncharacterized membrane protein YoaK (UPF0700 family)
MGKSSFSSRLIKALPLLLFVVICFLPAFCLADFDSSLEGIKFKLGGVILPVLSVIGLTAAAISFFTGNPAAKQHILYAILGCIFGFGAQGMVDMIRNTVR